MAAIQLCSQVIYSNYIFPADPLNPYVYGHTSQDIFYINQRVRDVVLFHPDGKDLYMQVISSGSDYWPLPWYLRDFTYVGWWDHVDIESPLAPLIITSPDQNDLLVKKMYETPKPGEKYLYVPLFEEGTELRPGVEVFGYLRNDYWVF
jgi:predicted membrane-bound mannosyltransferase